MRLMLLFRGVVLWPNYLSTQFFTGSYLHLDIGLIASLLLQKEERSGEVSPPRMHLAALPGAKAVQVANTSINVSSVLRTF